MKKTNRKNKKPIKMSLKYLQAIAKHGLSEQELSVRIKKEIREINRLVKAVDDAKAKLQTLKTEKSKASLQADIEEANAEIVSLDDQLVERVEKFVANREVNQKRAENLAKSRAKKQDGGTVDLPPPAVAIADEGTETGASNEAAPSGEDDPVPENTDVSGLKSEGKGEKKEEKKTGWGMVFGGILLIAAAVMGYNYYNNQK